MEIAANSIEIVAISIEFGVRPIEFAANSISFSLSPGARDTLQPARSDHPRLTSATITVHDSAPAAGPPVL